MDITAKMKAIRAKEGLTQTEFCELVEISISSWKKYDAAITDMGLAPFLRSPTIRVFKVRVMAGHW